MTWWRDNVYLEAYFLMAFLLSKLAFWRSLVTQRAKDWHCHCYGSRYSCGLGSITGQRTFVCHRHAPPPKKKEKKKKTKRRQKMERHDNLFSWVFPCLHKGSSFLCKLHSGFSQDRGFIPVGGLERQFWIFFPVNGWLHSLGGGNFCPHRANQIKCPPPMA